MNQCGMSEFVLSHHAEKVIQENQKEESEYFGITKNGEKEARRKAMILANKINLLPKGAITILSGVSRAARTQATMAVYADELRNIFGDNNDVVFFPKLGELKEISIKIGENGNTKAIVEYLREIKVFIGLPGQTAKEKALCLLWRINKEEIFFRKFFPKNPLLLINVGHSAELEALFAHLAKGGERGKKFYFI